MCNLPTCDRCGQPVQPNNDAWLLYELMGYTRNQMVFDEGESRHILPEGECIGSPSTAQYIEGQPRDTRGICTYRPEMETEVRLAYEKLQALPVAA